MFKLRRALVLGLIMSMSACSQPTGGTPKQGAFEPTRQLLAPPPVSETPAANPPLQPCTPPVASGALTYEAQIENQLFDMINELREKAHVPALTQDVANLRGAAREKAYERSDSLIGSPLAERLARWCVRYKSSDHFSKGFPQGSYPAPDFITFVMDIPTAKALILNPAYNQIGIGVYRGGPSNRYYAALILIAAP